MIPVRFVLDGNVRVGISRIIRNGPGNGVAPLLMILFASAGGRSLSVFVLVQLAGHIETDVRKTPRLSASIAKTSVITATGIRVASVEWQFWGVDHEESLPGNKSNRLTASR